MSKIKNLIVMICLVIFAGVGASAIAGTTSQVNEQTAIVKAVERTAFEPANVNAELPTISDATTDVIIGQELSADEVGNMLTNVRFQSRLTVCPRCTITRCGSTRCFGKCKKNGRRFNCSRLRRSGERQTSTR